MNVKDPVWNTPARLDRARGLIAGAPAARRRLAPRLAAWGAAAAGFAALAACLGFVATPLGGPVEAAGPLARTADARGEPRRAAPALPAPVRVGPRRATPVAAPVAAPARTPIPAPASASQAARSSPPMAAPTEPLRESAAVAPAARAFALAGVAGAALADAPSPTPWGAPAAEAAAPLADGPQTPRVSAPTAHGPAAPHIAVVIDDIGLDARASARALALPGPLTLSILPYAPEAARVAAAARDAGHEVFVHVPMEPVGLDDPGPRALTTWLSVEEIRTRAGAAFDAVPGAVGFNNHMGSRFTSCGPCLEPVAEAAQARGFVALDSVTGGRTVLGRAAARAGLPVLSRDVFVDHVREPGAIAAALAEAEQAARTAGSAVVIAHPHDVTLEALEAWLPAARARGVQFVGAAALARAARG